MRWNVSIRMNESVGHEVFPKDKFISLVIISVFTTILAVPVNILVLFGYITSRSSRARPSSILLISLIFDQLLISIVVIPSQLLEVIRPDLVANGGVFLCFRGHRVLFTLYHYDRNFSLYISWQISCRKVYAQILNNNNKKTSRCCGCVYMDTCSPIPNSNWTICYTNWT